MVKCSVDGCETEAFCRGLCFKHYQRLRRNGTLKLKRKETEKIINNIKETIKNKCIIEGCENKYYARGYCKNHYSCYIRNPIRKRNREGCIEGMMKIIVCEVGKEPYEHEIKDKLYDMQEVVGGYIKNYYIPSLSRLGRYVVICDEEGNMKEKKENRFGLVGTFFICKDLGNELVGLSNVNVKRIMKFLKEEV